MGFILFPRPKKKDAIARLEFELTYNDVAIKSFHHYAREYLKLARELDESVGKRKKTYFSKKIKYNYVSILEIIDRKYNLVVVTTTGQLDWRERIKGTT